MQHMTGAARYILICACIMLTQCTVKKNEQSVSELTPFFGTYTGNSINVVQGEESERDLAVTIKPWDDNGFTVEWKAITYRADGKQKRAETSIDFYPSPRPGIFASAMRKDVFGKMVSYDPAGSDAAPYVWAGLEGEALTVRALYIVDNGEFEIHTYERTLQSGNLALEFERTRNGDRVTQVSAVLERVD